MIFPYNWYLFPLFDAWLDGTGRIPEIYWNTYSEEQRYKFLCCRLQKLVEYAEKMGLQLNLQGDAINQLAAELASMKEDFADQFEPYFKERICEWLNQNLTCLIGNIVKFVQFGMTDDGYLMAIIPTQWEFLKFSPPSEDYDAPDYGALCIEY